MWKILLPGLLLLGVVALTVLGDRPLPRADVVFINRGDVNTLDLHRMSWLQDLRVASALFEGLVTQDLFSDKQDITPGVAQRWELSPDRRTYTFHLREDARFSNGEPVTAHDFKRTWRRAVLEEVAGDYINLFQLVRGVDEFMAWRRQALADYERTRPDDPARRPDAARALWAQTQAKYDELVGVTALDDRTLRVELVRPTPYFLEVCAYEVYAPLYMPLVEQYQRLDPDTGRFVLELGWTQPPNLVGNGPYVLTVWRFKRDMRLEANPHYWNAANVPLRSIAIPSVNDPNAAVLAFTSGSVDWLSEIVTDYRRDMIADKQAYYREHADLYQRLKAQGLDPLAIDRRMPPDPRQNIHTFPAFGTYFFLFNCQERLADGRPNPFADARVRRAFALVVDKEAVSQIRGLGEPVTGRFIPEGTLPGYVSPAGIGFDPERARALLAEAGYPQGRNFPAVAVLFNRDAAHDRVSQSLARDWQKHLGVQCILETKEVKIFSQDRKSQNFIIARGGWYGDYGDPTTFLDLLKTGDGNNDGRYSFKPYDDLLEQAAAATDETQRLALLAQAERIIIEDELPVIPLVRYHNVTMFNPHRVGGLTPHPKQKQRLPFLDLIGDDRGPAQPRELPLRPQAPVN